MSNYNLNNVEYEPPLKMVRKNRREPLQKIAQLYTR